MRNLRTDNQSDRNDVGLSHAGNAITRSTLFTLYHANRRRLSPYRPTVLQLRELVDDIRFIRFIYIVNTQSRAEFVQYDRLVFEVFSMRLRQIDLSLCIISISHIYVCRVCVYNDDICSGIYTECLSRSYPSIVLFVHGFFDEVKDNDFSRYELNAETKCFSLVFVFNVKFYVLVTKLPSDT